MGLVREMAAGLGAGSLIVATLAAPPAFLARVLRDAGILGPGTAAVMAMGAALVGLLAACVYLIFPLPPLEDANPNLEDFPDLW